MFTELNEKELEVLKPFFDNPELEVSIRELSRRSNVSPRWVSKIADELAEGVLEIEKTNVTKNISTGKDFSRLKRFYNIDTIYSSGLVAFIDKELRADAIVLFGSFEKGEDLKDSDIDIAIVNGRQKDLEVSKYEEKLKRDINLHNIDSTDEVNENFRNSLANGTVLKGFLKVI